MVTNSNQVNLEIPLEESEISIGEVVIKASPLQKDRNSGFCQDYRHR